MCGFFYIFRSEYDAEQFVGSSVPIIVVGTKLDMVLPLGDKGNPLRVSSIADECGAHEINLVRILFSRLFSCFSVVMYI